MAYTDLSGTLKLMLNIEKTKNLLNRTFKYLFTEKYYLNNRTGRIANFPIKKNDIVLEIGSGSNPILRADVLLDKYVAKSEIHRSSGKIVKIDERPFIIGDAKDLPFIKNAFDFVVARHLLEHLSKPRKFVSELNRVSRGGYIETPSPFTGLIHGGYQNINSTIPEKIVNKLHHGKGTKGHKWFVLANGSEIIMTAKSKNIYGIYVLLGYFVKHNPHCISWLK